jgi:hypothetical protein
MSSITANSKSAGNRSTFDIHQYERRDRSKNG